MNHHQIIHDKIKGIIDSIPTMTLKSTTIVGNGDRIGSRISRTENGKKVVGYFSSQSRSINQSPGIRNFLIEISGLHTWWTKTSREFSNQRYVTSKEVTNELDLQIKSLDPAKKQHLEYIMNETLNAVNGLVNKRDEVINHKNRVRRKKAEEALNSWIKEAMSVGVSIEEIQDILKTVTIQEVMDI